MNQATFSLVDRYVAETFNADDGTLSSTLESIRAAGMPEISVSPAQGKFLNLMAQLVKAERILEIGTLGGYSTIWLSRALPADGTLISLELEERHAEVARRNVEAAGQSQKVEIRVGRAVDLLADLVIERSEPFDLIFIDADKPSYPEYLDWSLKLSRPGTLLIADNVVWNGEVADETIEDETVIGVRRFNEALAATPGVNSGVLQTVGAKGHDGMAFAVVETTGS